MLPLVYRSLVGRRAEGGRGFFGGFRGLGRGGEGGSASFHFMRIQSLETVYTWGTQMAIDVMV